MEITTKKHDGVLELKIKGRVDAQWSEHLSAELKEVVQGGSHDIRVDMSDVVFMSSAGIRVLLYSYKQLNSIGGSFAIINPSDIVRGIMETSGLMKLFSAPMPVKSKDGDAESGADRVSKEDVNFDVFPQKKSDLMAYRLIGDPTVLADKSRVPNESSKLSAKKDTLALGLGAFGADHDDCRDRFGEFLAVSGTAIHLPPESGEAADYMLSAESFIPEVHVLYGAVCEGAFSHFIRFEAKEDVPGAGLSKLVQGALEISGFKKAAIVMVAESAGLIGAALTHSPTEREDGTDMFTYPDIHKWLSFSPERVYDKCLTLTCGVAGVEGENDDFLRKIGVNSVPVGHFHSAAFDYAPMAHGRLDLSKTVTTLYENETLNGMLHLLCDDHGEDGAAESEFLRGAIWIGGIK